MANIGVQETTQKNVKFLQINKKGIIANDSTIFIPGPFHILIFDIDETSGNAITGGLNVGSTAAGTDIISGVAVAGSAYFAVADAALLKRSFKAGTTLFLTPGSSWNSASINLTLIIAYRQDPNSV